MVALVYVYSDINSKNELDPFNSEYVFALIDKEERLQKSMVDLSKQLNATSEQLFETQIQLQQTRILTNKSEEKYLQCDAKLNAINSMSSSSATSNDVNCEASSAKLLDSQNSLFTVQQQLSYSENRYFALKEKFVATEQLLKQAQNIENRKVSALEEQLARLTNAINAPISLQQHFLSARYCDKPKYRNRICVIEFMARPSFSKPPVTRLGISIRDINDKIIVENEFNSAQNQLYRINLGRGKELDSGKYRVIYTVDNQTIQADWVNIVQES